MSLLANGWNENLDEAFVQKTLGKSLSECTADELYPLRLQNRINILKASPLPWYWYTVDVSLILVCVHVT